jgi:hypothetical protein
MTMDIILLVVVGRPRNRTVAIHSPHPNPCNDVLQQWAIHDYAVVIAILSFEHGCILRRKH